MGHEQVVQPARTAQPDLVGGVEHAGGIAQQIARVIERQRGKEILRRQPGPAAEQMMQFGRRHLGSFRDGVDIGLLAPIAADMGDGSTHHVVIVGGAGEIADAVGGEHGLPRCGHVSVQLVRRRGHTHPISDQGMIPKSGTGFG